MKTITVEAVKARIDAGEKLLLLDVREPHEHADFNIGGTTGMDSHVATILKVEVSVPVIK